MKTTAVFLQFLLILAVATGTFGLDATRDIHSEVRVHVLRQVSSRQLESTLGAAMAHRKLVSCVNKKGKLFKCNKSCKDKASKKCQKHAEKMDVCCGKTCRCEDDNDKSKPKPPNPPDPTSPENRRPFECNDCRCCKDKCAVMHSKKSDKKNCKTNICRKYFTREACNDD